MASQSSNPTSRVHPAPRKIDDEEVATTTTNSPSVWTVWKKSSMGFRGTYGFSIYDSMGRLSFGSTITRGSANYRSTHVFDIRRRLVLQSCDEAEVLMDSTPDHKLPDFTTEGCFRRRNCKIMDRNGDEVTRISRNKEKNSVAPGDDVFSLIIQPNMETEQMAAFPVFMDRICA
ncbi:hypothetical protein C4D60_Mb04t02360 [Musa balbisiana]|uniref:Tubby C-terminal domain-containing protein n=1 Tax=Musa balbisiana TaxID=52838 RepID=A0A4S8K931_MUSBA|nr:hypothetical protein C4D60_Mb04t02360 [Musa balbisiana]